MINWYKNRQSKKKIRKNLSEAKRKGIVGGLIGAASGAGVAAFKTKGLLDKAADDAGLEKGTQEYEHFMNEHSPIAYRRGVGAGAGLGALAGSLRAAPSLTRAGREYLKVRKRR